MVESWPVGMGRLDKRQYTLHVLKTGLWEVVDGMEQALSQEKQFKKDLNGRGK